MKTCATIGCENSFEVGNVVLVTDPVAHLAEVCNNCHEELGASIAVLEIVNVPEQTKGSIAARV